MYLVVVIIVLSGLTLGCWLNRVIKRAVVQPVAQDGKLLDARLSEKKRYASIIEAHGFAIGFLTALALVGLAWWWAAT